MAHDLMAIFGAVLIIFGVTLLVLVDAPRWMFARVVALGGLRNRAPGARPTAHTTSNGIGTGTSSERPGQFALAAYRGLAPGWYRDSSNRTLARYWDGSTLSAQTRPVTPPQQSAPIAPQPSPYVGLPAGWYRDEASPGLARFWNGTALGDERRLIAT